LIALNSVQADADLSQTTNLSVLENVIDVPVLEVEHDQDDFSDLVERLL
jgi:hypothetical protein